MSFELEGEDTVLRRPVISSAEQPPTAAASYSNVPPRSSASRQAPITPSSRRAPTTSAFGSAAVSRRSRLSGITGSVPYQDTRRVDEDIRMLGQRRSETRPDIPLATGLTKGGNTTSNNSIKETERGLIVPAGKKQT